MLASQPQSASTYTVDKLSQRENIRIENIARGIDPYGVVEQDLDVKKVDCLIQLLSLSMMSPIRFQ